MAWQKWVGLFTVVAVVLGLVMVAFTAHRSTDYNRDPCVGVAAATGTEAKVVAVNPTISEAVVFGSAICVSVSQLSTDKDHPLILFLNGEPMSSLVGRVEDTQKQLVSFRLDRTEEDAVRWSRLIGAPPILGANGGKVILNVSVGKADEGPLPRDEKAQITFLVFSQVALWSGLAALAAAVAVLVILARNTAILRDEDATSSYSLGRCQMAWWLYLVTASFLYIWLVTGQISGVLTSDALVLLGISSSTGLAAMFIPPAQAAQPAAAALPTQAKQGFARFLHDILYSELANGRETPQLHRIQMVVWTIILGFAFVWEVYSGFRMPKFDTNLLIMMGISGSLYLGFKFKET